MPSAPTRSMVGVSEHVPDVEHVLGSKLAPRPESGIVRNSGGLALSNNQAVFSLPSQSVYWRRKLCTVAVVPPILALSMNQLPSRYAVEFSWVEASDQVMVGCVVEVVEPLGVTTHCGSKVCCAGTGVALRHGAVGARASTI